MGILVPGGRERRLDKEKTKGEKWRRRRAEEGWPELAKTESGGVNIVAETVSESKEPETRFRVKDIAM